MRRDSLLVNGAEPVNRYTKLRRAGTVQSDEARRAAPLAAFGRMLDDRRPDIRDNDPEIQRMIAEQTDTAARTAMRYMVDTVAFAREVLEIEPEGPGQILALQTWSRRIILLCSRQWGKSTVSAIRVLHRAWFWPRSLILLVSRAQMQTSGLLEKVKAFLPALGVGKVHGDGVNRKSVKLPNRSRIVALPGGPRPTRSHSKVSMVVIDEAAMVPEQVFEAVAPTLARTNGELILASTPMGKRGTFYRIWTYGGEEWCKVFGPVDETTGAISAAFLARELAEKGQDCVDREFRCVFIDTDSFVFTEKDLESVFSEDFECWEESGV